MCICVHKYSCVHHVYIGSHAHIKAQVQERVGLKGISMIFGAVSSLEVVEAIAKFAGRQDSPTEFDMWHMMLSKLQNEWLAGGFKDFLIFGPTRGNDPI